MRGTKQSPAQSHRPVSSESSKLLLDRFRPAGTASGRQYALVLHCTRYIVVQTNLIALCLVKFPESSGETILLSRGNTSVELYPQTPFRGGEDLKHGDQLEFASLRIEEYFNFFSCRTNELRPVWPERLSDDIVTRSEVPKNTCSGFRSGRVETRTRSKRSRY
jgi:hypothetical protein